MIKLIHCADLHLDSPFAGLAPEQAALRRAEQRDLLDRLCDLAQDEGADLVLLSGDLFDSRQIYRETVDALAAALGRVPVPVFLAPGNHDPYGPLSPYALPIWPDNVHIFTSSVPEGVDLPSLGCTVYGAAFTSEHPARSPLVGFHAPRDGRVHLMTLHGDVGGTDYGPLSVSDIADSGLTYLALGHVHQTGGLQRAGDTFWAYSGCPEGRGFDETGDKGALVVTIDGGVTAEFRPLCRRRYHVITADLTGAADALTAVESVLPRDARQDVVRLELRGQFAMEPSALDSLRASLAGRFYALDIRDHTLMPRDLWARAGEDSLTGLFLRAMQERCAREPDNEVFQQAARFGLIALERGEDVSL